jgi:FAD/FMN-containing dehydrogenase/Fe-S oxidoreductase
MRSELLRIDESPLARALRRDVDGEVHFDRGARALYATDASNYRHVPIGVVVPRTVDALVSAAAICREHDAPILPRGGGTSLAGQTCNHAVILDCSKHLGGVDLDPDTGIAVVEPGVVLDHLKDVAAPHGWDFGPDPSTHDRCTLGGMLGNDSCGVHSVMSEFYGPGPRTAHHVEWLDALTYDGVRFRAGLLDGSGPFDAALARFADRWRDAIRARFPELPRRVSGYSLPELLDGHLGRALVGSEATCVLILRAALQLTRRLRARSVVLIGYPDIVRAAGDVMLARELRPVGCEAIDDRLRDRVHRRGDAEDALALLPDGRAWLIVEHGATTETEARSLADATARRFGNGTNVRVLHEHREMDTLRDIREAALGATAFLRGERDTYEGWEDAAVPPARLAAYLAEFDHLLAEHQLEGALYGHFGQGCVHTRIDFDLRSDAGIERYRRFTADAAALVTRHGGSLSGEHGDGQSRADLLGVQYGPEIVTAFEDFKGIFDPRDRMNPGKIVRPRGRTDDLRLRDYHPSPGRIELSHGDDGHDFGHAAVRCVGIGRCRKTDAGTMCPSYMVTRDERHSTRGRAHLLFEMLRGDVIRDGWRSREVADALHLCLGCKACKAECPVQVDMASYKAEFLAHHHRAVRRPRAAYVFGWIARWLRLARPFAWLANRVIDLPIIGRLLKRIAGIAREREVPKLARRTFRRRFRPDAAYPDVILWPDTFHDHLHPEVLEAAAEALRGAGLAVAIPSGKLCCGRPLFEQGWLAEARRGLVEIIGALDGDTPIVGVEPSCVAMFRDELRALLPDDPRAERLAQRTFTIAELFRARALTPPPLAGRAIFHHHCHQAAVLSRDAEPELLTAMGLDVERLDAGCCGMAGPFGFQRDTYAVSVALAERKLLPAVRAAAPGTLVVADGFSCREQLRQLAGVRALHVAEVLALAYGRLTRDRPPRRPRSPSAPRRSAPPAHPR